ncbi:recombinase RecT [Sulfuricurvum sp.]|uniref:recombinase RecT n=1 Tax=Sulfuricurvum sp. TaxID=2025608 RepID=UPI003568EB5C
MAKQNEVAKQAEEQATDGIASIETIVKKSLKTLGEAMPSHMNPERLVRIALTTLRLNPKLYKCTPQSFMGALFQSAQLGLEPNIEGQAYIIPFNNSRKDPATGRWNKVLEAQFQIGYKGYIDLFYRHSSAVSLDAQEVRENDQFDFKHGTNAFLRHKRLLKNRGDVIAYFAIAVLKHEAEIFHVMSVDECMDHGKKHSKCWVTKEWDEGKKSYVEVKAPYFLKDTPWATDPGSMCKKTVLIQLMKLLPKSIELQKAVAMDNTIKTDVMADMSVAKDNTNWEAEDAVFDEDAKTQERAPKETNENVGPTTPPPETGYRKEGPQTPNDGPTVLYISEPQRKRLLAIAGSKGHSHDQVKEYLSFHHEIGATSEIPISKYEEIVAHYEAL